jgi:hypothetical protein
MTRDESAGLRRIIKDRPEWQGWLKRAARESATIAALCGGYEIAGRGLEHWQGADGPDREAKLQDLLLLQTMLERLIHACSPLPSTCCGPRRRLLQKAPEEGHRTQELAGPTSGHKNGARKMHSA